MKELMLHLRPEEPEHKRNKRKKQENIRLPGCFPSSVLLPHAATVSWDLPSKSTSCFSIVGWNLLLKPWAGKERTLLLNISNLNLLLPTWYRYHLRIQEWTHQTKTLPSWALTVNTIMKSLHRMWNGEKRQEENKPGLQGVRKGGVQGRVTHLNRIVRVDVTIKRGI